jgi:hypothetical protein
MATQAQIEANRQNAQKSTGPKSPPGKCASAANSTKHGLTAEKLVLPEHRAEAMRRKERWNDELRPGTLTGLYALDRMVAMSLRIEQCQNTLDGLFVAETTEAKLDWPGLRRREAVVLAEGLAKRPDRVAAQLQETRQGVELLIERWDYLIAALEQGEWDESDRALALDLLGVPLHHRKPGRTPVDPRDGAALIPFIAAVIGREVARLQEQLETVLLATDDLACAHGQAWLKVLLGKPAALVMRYEREACRRFSAAMRTVLAEPKADTPLPFDTEPEPDFEGPPVRVELVPPEGLAMPEAYFRRLEAAAAESGPVEDPVPPIATPASPVTTRDPSFTRAAHPSPRHGNRRDRRAAKARARQSG